MRTPHIHLFEPTGFGGVFQHSCALAKLLADNGHAVTLHTSAQREQVDMEGVDICACVWWPRGGRQTASRKARIVARYLGRTLPHLHRVAADGEIVHVQGGQASGLLAAATIAVARRRRRRVVYSPHNTFSRGGAVDGAFQRGSLSLADVVVAYSIADVEALESLGADARLSPLVQLVPEPSPEAKEAWRESWNAAPEDDVVLFAGQVRADKRLDVLIESASDWPEERKLAVVGEDRGAWPECARLADDRDVELAAEIGFVPLKDFTAAIAAADLVVAPYERASQSGVLAVARQLGVPTVASDIGGLAELAGRAVPPNDVGALREAIDEELSGSEQPSSEEFEGSALDAHVGAYTREAALA